MIPFFTNIKDFSRYLKIVPILSISMLFVLGSCNTKKFLTEEQNLLKKNVIIFDTQEKIQKKRSLTYELGTLYKQRPNSKTFRLFRFNLWLHYKTVHLEDPSKFQKWIRRRIAEPPALYDDLIAEETANSMKYYLQNKGYYNAEVSYDKVINKRRKQATITYTVDPKSLYTIDSVFFNSEDPKIARVLSDSKEDTHLKRGQPVSSGVYNKEVDRINTTLQNLGYAYFDRNFVDNLTGDSTGTKVNISLNVLNPRNQPEHKIYTIGSISVIPRYFPSELFKPKQDSIIEGIKFIIDDYGFVVNPKSIIREIFLKEGDLYKEKNYTKTNQQLGRLDIYKFISIKSAIDKTDPTKINFEIRLTPKKRMVIGGDFEFNNSNYRSSSENTSLFGIGVNLNYQNRNFRKNASLLELKANNGIEFDLSNRDNPIFSLDILTQADWYIPKFVQFPKLYTGLSRLNLINKNFINDLREKGETRVSASYNRLLLFDFYNYHSLNVSFGYDLTRNSNNRYSWNQIGINYFLPRFEAGFCPIIKTNPFLRNSFTKQLFTGFLFRDFKYTHTGKTNLFGSSWKFIGDIELSGAEVFLANYTYNQIAGKSSEFFILDTVKFSQYIRLNLDLRRYISVWKDGILAYKVSVGVAKPFGFSENVPYVKQFYGGGPYGNRAWRIRELGPGSFVEDPATDPQLNNQIFYQTGDFKIDLSLELRFKVFGGLYGALFVDGGNVWTLEKDPNRPGSQFLWTADPLVPESASFYNQFAVGTGVGIRYDFSYFVLGLDFGIKARNPFPDEDGRYWLFHRWDKLQIKDVNPNLLIGFPF